MILMSNDGSRSGPSKTIQTLQVRSSPVDDVASARVKAGAVLALIAAIVIVVGYIGLWKGWWKPEVRSTYGPARGRRISLGPRLHFDRAAVPGWARFGSHPGSPMTRPATVSIAAIRPSTSTAAAVQSGSPAVIPEIEPGALRGRPAPRDPRAPRSHESPSSNIFDRNDRKGIEPSGRGSISARASVTEIDAGDDGYLSDTTMSTIPPSYRTRRTTILRAEKHPLPSSTPSTSTEGPDAHPPSSFPRTRSRRRMHGPRVAQHQNAPRHAQVSVGSRGQPFKRKQSKDGGVRLAGGSSGPFEQEILPPEYEE